MDKEIDKLVDTYYKNAEKAYIEGDYEQTEQYLKNIEELENNNLPAKILSAKTLYHQGFYDEALNSLNNILNNNQNTDSKLLCDIQEFLGYIHYQNANYADAIKEFSNAINSNPNTKNLAEIFEYRGICYYETNEPIEALFDIAKAIDLTKGKTVNELGEYIRKINEENPNTEEIKNCIENFDGKYLYYCIETDNIEYFAEHLNYQNAINLLNTAIEENEYEKDTCTYLKGKISYSKGNYENALNYLTEAINYIENDEGWYYHTEDMYYYRGLTYIKLNQRQNAKNDLTKALEIAKENNNSDEKSEKLKEYTNTLDNIDRINILTCSAEQLLQIEGFDENKANTFIKAREEGKLYYDIDSFAQDYQIQPHIILELQDKIIFPQKPKNKLGRKVDW